MTMFSSDVQEEISNRHGFHRRGCWVPPAPIDITSPPNPVENEENKTRLPLKQDTFIHLLAELEKWAPIFGRLPIHQARPMREYLDFMISQLNNHPLPDTREQQLEELERLTKLQEGPLGFRIFFDGKTAMNVVVELRLGALSGVNCDEVDCDGVSYGYQADKADQPSTSLPQVRPTDRREASNAFAMLFPQAPKNTVHPEVPLMGNDGDSIFGDASDLRRSDHL